MAGQLDSVKAQLTRQREQNNALETAVRRRDRDAEQLREMVQQKVAEGADGPA